MKLRELIEAWLKAIGFVSYEITNEHDETETMWGHPSLGYGRPFRETMLWALGCEQMGRDLRAEADKYHAEVAGTQAQKAAV